MGCSGWGWGGAFGGGSELGDEPGGDSPANGCGAVFEASVGDGYDSALPVEDGSSGVAREQMAVDAVDLEVERGRSAG